ncbi:hypothetical protein E2C01_004190 [Portunus trituberculatus]|uniref:Uncharacterized protein n=1 Tax=Portunus trituberculatus TaxID=210409 RepID=A0A5B7CVP2_PORTR|nr:hypothetical protein [Portunus trituberculatus]
MVRGGEGKKAADVGWWNGREPGIDGLRLVAGSGKSEWGCRLREDRVPCQCNRLWCRRRRLTGTKEAGGDRSVLEKVRNK